jgi:hypothetical protein
MRKTNGGVSPSASSVKDSVSSRLSNNFDKPLQENKTASSGFKSKIKPPTLFGGRRNTEIHKPMTIN